VATGAATSASGLVLTTLAGYLILVHSLVLAAGLLGHLTVGGVGTLLATALVMSLWRARRVWHDPRPVETSPPPGLGAWGRSLVAGGALGVWAWPHLVEATRLWIWDDYTYHLVYPALWLREHAIASPIPAQTFTMQAWYPLSADVVAAWFMAPLSGSRGDALAWVSLTGTLYAGLVAAGVAVLLTRAGCRPGAWAVPALLFATSPRIGIMASSFSDADLAQAAALLGALAFAVPREAEEAERDVRADAWYAGLLSGLALGIKVSAAPLALVILVMLALRGRAVARAAGALGITLVVAASWLVTGGYWYLRNLICTGNPVYPAAFLGRSGTTFPETTLLEYARHYGLRRGLADALIVYADWPRTHAVLAVVGLLGLGAWLAWRRRSATRAQRYLGGGTLVSAATILILLPLAPYSAGNAMTFRSGFVHWDSMRYVALAPILGWVALAFLVDASGPRSHVATSAPRRWMTARRRVLALGAAVLVLALIVVTRHDSKAAATAAALHHEPLFGATVATLDRQPPGTRVAVFGDQWIYPAFGERDHLQPVRLDRDGRLATAPIGDAMQPGDLTVDAPTFRANLAASGVSVVVIVHLPHPGRSPRWPTQHAALETLADARLLHLDAVAAVWRLGP
jgi:glycosyl transferase family 87